MITFCGLNEKADEAGFVAVYPNGTGRVQRALIYNGGNCCGRAQRDDVDDVKFTREVLDDLETLLAVDQKRIFATGMSRSQAPAWERTAPDAPPPKPGDQS